MNPLRIGVLFAFLLVWGTATAASLIISPTTTTTTYLHFVEDNSVSKAQFQQVLANHRDEENENNREGGSDYKFGENSPLDVVDGISKDQYQDQSQYQNQNRERTEGRQGNEETSQEEEKREVPGTLRKRNLRFTKSEADATTTLHNFENARPSNELHGFANDVLVKTSILTRTSKGRTLLENKDGKKKEKEKKNEEYDDSFTLEVDVHNEHLTLEMHPMKRLLKNNFKHIVFDGESSFHAENVANETELNCFYSVKIKNDGNHDDDARTRTHTHTHTHTVRNGGVLSTCKGQVRAHVLRVVKHERRDEGNEDNSEGKAAQQESESEEDLSFDIEPMDASGTRHGVFLSRDDHTDLGTCGTTDEEDGEDGDGDVENTGTDGSTKKHKHDHSHRRRRSLLNDRQDRRHLKSHDKVQTHLGVLLINDRAYTRRFGASSIDRTMQLLSQVVSHYDVFPGEFGVEAQASGIVTLGFDWPSNIFDSRGNAFSTSLLQTFTSWVQHPSVIGTLKRYFNYNVVHLVTGHRLQGGTAGIAWLSQSCTLWGTGVTESFSSITATSLVLTHEIGHNLGLQHTNVALPDGSSPCGFGAYYMNPSLRSGVKWCEVSPEWYSIYLNSRSHAACMFNEVEASCGNGIVEEGEDCDCIFGSCDRGGDDDGNNCCDSDTCTFKSSGTVCNEAKHPTCDVDVQCDGTSSACPAKDQDTIQEKLDELAGEPCTFSNDGGTGEGECHEGECVTDRPTPPTTASPTTAPPTTAPPSTLPPTTTAPPSTLPPTTTAPPSTLPTTLSPTPTPTPRPSTASPTASMLSDCPTTDFDNTLIRCEQNPAGAFLPPDQNRGNTPIPEFCGSLCLEHQGPLEENKFFTGCRAWSWNTNLNACILRACDPDGSGFFQAATLNGARAWRSGVMDSNCFPTGEATQSPTVPCEYDNTADPPNFSKQRTAKSCEITKHAFDSTLSMSVRQRLDWCERQCSSNSVVEGCVAVEYIPFNAVSICSFLSCTDPGETINTRVYSSAKVDRNCGV